MKPIVALLVTSFFGVGVLPAQQVLVCPPASSSGPGECEAFHYHVQMYRSQPRGFVYATATPRFATQAACEKALEAHLVRNQAVVQYFKQTRNEQNYEADRFGPCHCDLTRETTNAAFLNDAQRGVQLRAVEDVRLRVREKLLASGLTSADELVRSLLAQAETLPMLGAPKVVTLPRGPASAASLSPADLRSTAAAEAAKPVVAALDLPLAAVDSGSSFATAAGETEELASAADGDPAAEDPDVAAVFIEQETARIQEVLSAAAAVTDEGLKHRIFEATLQRTQVLSNLRTLIEGSGVRSRLAAAARAAESEEDRLALVSSLFGDSIAPHWSPTRPADVILPADRDVDSEPERVLRDSGGRYTEQQKKRALYTLLSRAQPSAEQQLWLITVVDSFLR
ncbi:MAG TPA: hypothetical protein VNA04_07785 [Thermoanaerobaculia bacterium]|nr:hypothetical protein [Thermoanaerobaculia bacterium]